MSLFRTKTVERSIAETDEPDHRLKKDLSAWDLTVFGVGVMIGTGIFVLTGQEAHKNAGPAIVLSFVIAGVVCGLAALCYAEFASTVPVAGSAYTFSYATLGEFIAWIIGWDLVLELALGAAVVSRGWSAYLQELFDLPTWLAGGDALPDIAAIAIVVGLTTLAVFGTKLSGRFTGVLVVVKVAVVLFVIVAGLFFVKAANLTPFVPASQSADPKSVGSGLDSTLLQSIFGVEPTVFGIYGIIAAASVVFFAFIGFDIVATSAEETKNPQRDMPRGIIGSLAIVTVLYAAVAFVVTGMLKYSDDRMNTGAPLAAAFSANGLEWASKIISVGAVAGLTTVVLVLMLGQARVLFAMARDGLLPQGLAKVHPRFGTPYKITIITGVFVAVLAGFVPLDELSKLVSIGTLFAFVVVSAGVIVLRRTRPELDRAFRVPLVPLIPVLSIAACLWLMVNLSVETWLRFLVWMVLGIVLYFVYGRRHSRLGIDQAAGRA
ncbi:MULTISPECIES: amino acid permease [unclassified Aeromicrobium]|uniref:amino acid permease n=1 Tax=unclassified Aeromicrobium TaxID=2633570 RepID=UPI0020983EE4|nr:MULTISPECIES: amino acid permease [unclassified Aeromicrobium]MCO7237779.1 amino acid permease [Aeromicrobium sp. CnD17-E]MDR6117741.1 APA family basic amino acid/polyamine antiporter [Aeromicrobium sp. SORGH_AS_0981]